MATETVPAGTRAPLLSDLPIHVDGLHDVNALLLALMDYDDAHVNRIARIASDKVRDLANELDKLHLRDVSAPQIGGAA